MQGFRVELELTYAFGGLIIDLRLALNPKWLGPGFIF